MSAILGLIIGGLIGLFLGRLTHEGYEKAATYADTKPDIIGICAWCERKIRFNVNPPLVGFWLHLSRYPGGVEPMNCHDGEHMASPTRSKT